MDAEPVALVDVVKAVEELGSGAVCGCAFRSASSARSSRLAKFDSSISCSVATDCRRDISISSAAIFASAEQLIIDSSGLAASRR